MLKNKQHFFWPAIIVLLTLSPLPVLATSNSLISQDMIKAETANYNTHTISYGLYEKTNSRSLTEYYPYIYQLRFEQQGATFIEYLVRRGQEVKKGDILARFSLKIDEVSLASKRLSLKRMEESFEKGRLERHESIHLQKETLYSIQDPYDQAIALKKIQRDELALEQYIYQQELNISSLQAEIAEIEESMTQNVLISPFDGVVEKITYKQEGDVISPTETLITLYRDDVLLLRADNKDQAFRFGMEVQVEVGRNKNKTILTGRVVGADNLIPESRRLGYAFIQLDPYDEASIRLNSPKVIASTYYLENVMVVPRKAVTLESGKFYVNQLIDGIPRKRYVNCVMQTSAGAWIMQGLADGDVIVID